MRQWTRQIDLRRCARGFIMNPGTATNTTLALTNNSVSAELLLIWQVEPGNVFGSTLQTSYQQTLSGLTPGGFIEPLVPSDAPPPGVLSSGDEPIQFQYSWFQVASALIWPATFPFAVLNPGWSLVFQQASTVPTIGADVNIFWEAMKPEIFENIYTGPTLREIYRSRER